MIASKEFPYTGKLQISDKKSNLHDSEQGVPINWGHQLQISDTTSNLHESEQGVPIHREATNK
jgi:hypothetical protein